MNKVILMGRLTRDPDVRYSQGDKPTANARYDLAVNRNFKDADGKYGVDFLHCVAFGKNAEFAEKYLKQGTQILVEGRIQTGSYTNKDGVKVYTTDIFVEKQEFAGSKSDNQQNNDRPKPSGTGNDGFMSIPDGIEDELPFQ